MTFERAIEFVLRFEGEHSDDPNDPGGDTWYGISRRAHPQLEPWPPTRQTAVEIYRRDYWLKCRCAELPGPLALIVFDCAVNQGAATAIRLLQKTLDVRADGILGPKTMGAVSRCSLRLVVPELVARRAYQYCLNPSAVRFGLGWYRRLMACHQVAMEPQ